MKKIIRICQLLLTLLAVVVLGFSTLMTASAAEPGDPDTAIVITDATLECGSTATNQILVSVANDPAAPRPVHGVEVQLSFDPTKFQVVDADETLEGVQIAAEGGFFPLDEQAIVQKVDNTAGTILFAVSQLSGASVSDATDAPIATITWEALFDCATVMEVQSTVNVEGTLMSDADGYPIAVDTIRDGTIILEDGGITGIVKLQGRYDHSGTMVSTVLETPGCCQVFTDAEGYFKTVPTEGGDYTVTAWKQGYLRAYKTGVPYNPGQLTDMGPVTLLGGDVVPDEVIDICDITYIASRFGGTDVLADITGDGQVNILDLTMAAANFGRSGPIPWETA